MALTVLEPLLHACVCGMICLSADCSSSFYSLNTSHTCSCLRALASAVPNIRRRDPPPREITRHLPRPCPCPCHHSLGVPGETPFVTPTSDDGRLFQQKQHSTMGQINTFMLEIRIHIVTMKQKAKARTHHTQTSTNQLDSSEKKMQTSESGPSGGSAHRGQLEPGGHIDQRADQEETERERPGWSSFRSVILIPGCTFESPGEIF